MGYMIITQVIKHIHKEKLELAQQELEFVALFACRSIDAELTYQLLEELTKPGADKQRVCRKYEIMMDIPSESIKNQEELLAALVIYQMEEERRIKLLEGLILGCQSPQKENYRSRKTMEEAKKEVWEEQSQREEDVYVGRNSAGGTDYKSRL